MITREPAEPPASWSASEDPLAGEPCSEQLWGGVSGTAVRNLNSVGWKRPSVFRGVKFTLKVRRMLNGMGSFSFFVLSVHFL